MGSNIDTTSLESLFRKFEGVLEEKAPQIKDSFATGLKEEFIKKMLLSEKIDAPELVKLYSWNNGLIEGLNYYIVKYNICSFGKIIPFNSALSLFMANKMGTKPMWKKTLFPIISTNAGEYLLYDTDKKSKTHGMILLYSAELLVTSPETAYDSLSNLFETFIRCYEQNIYSYDSDANELKIDFEAEHKLSAKLNPKSNYWKE